MLLVIELPMYRLAKHGLHRTDLVTISVTSWVGFAIETGRSQSHIAIDYVRTQISTSYYNKKKLPRLQRMAFTEYTVKSTFNTS